MLQKNRQTLASALADEKTIWTGHPIPGVHLRGVDLTGLITGGLCLAVVAWFLSRMISSGGQYTVAAIVAGVAVFAGFWQTAGRVLLQLYERSQSTYALTDDGFAVIFSKAFGGRTHLIYLPALDAIDVDPWNETAGSITFGSIPPRQWWERRWYDPRLPAFEFIPNVSDVYDLCTKLQQGKSAS